MIPHPHTSEQTCPVKVFQTHHSTVSECGIITRMKNLFTPTTVTLLATVLLCELYTMRVFFYQRTVRVLVVRLQLHLEVLLGKSIAEIQKVFYPALMLKLFRLTHLKFVMVLVLFFLDWRCALIAIGILIVLFMLSVLLPYSDYAHLLAIREAVYSNRHEVSDEAYEFIQEEISRAIDKIGGPKPPPIGESPMPRVTSFFTWFYSCVFCYLAIVAGGAVIELIVKHKFSHKFSIFDVVLCLVAGTLVWYKGRKKR